MNPSIQKTLVFSGLTQNVVNRTAEYSLDASGKGINVSRVLTQLGKNCCHLTQLGGVFRPIFLELCNQDGIRVEWVESSSPVRFCYTLLDRTKKSVTELVEESEQVGEGTGEKLLEAFSKLILDFSCLIISGSKAAGFPDNIIPDMVKLARAERLRVILDIRGKDLIESLPYGPDIIKLNMEEFLSTFVPELYPEKGIPPKELKKRIAGIWTEINGKYPCSLIVTRGADSVWYTEEGEFIEYTFDPIIPLNTTGSGDSFTAGLAAALEEGAALGEAVIRGAKCGALNAALLRPGVIC
jgi:1-phosphofructokinase/tagatose 6-phosphate kinase